MIACLSKNDRASRIFSELAQLDSRYVDVGTVGASRRSRLLGAFASAGPNLQQVRTDTGFSPFVARSMEEHGEELLKKVSSLSAILYWGATNFPTGPKLRHIPYFVITDGPFDPQDASYPVEWKPRRWQSDYFRRQRAIYSGALHVFTLSEWARQKLLTVHGLSEDKVTRTGWGPMHTSEYPNFTLKSKGYFLSVGNEWARKGMDVLHQAARDLHQKYPDANTILVGSPSGLTLQSGKGVAVIPHPLPGMVTQTLIANARAFVVASRFDASPHVIYEALQAGTPVIGTEVCGIAEAIHAPQGGLTVPVGDCRALFAAMEEIWRVENFAPRREAAYAVFQQSRGWTACAEIIQQTIDIALGKAAVKIRPNRVFRESVFKEIG
jgi:glycosyltransferase involved in cell wall biosynthesis